MLRAETEVANARQGWISARNGVELAKAAFNNVLGRPLDTPVELADPGSPRFVSLDLAPCIESACRARAEVLRADSQIGFSDSMTKIARLGSKPQFNFRWGYNRNFDTTLFSSQSNSWKAFITGSLSLYDGGATKAAISKAESDSNNARSTREQVVKAVALDTQQSYLSMAESRERINAAEKALEQATEAMRLADVRFKSGLSTQVEVLDAQTALTAAETNHVNALYDYQIAQARLEHAVGGHVQMAKLLEQSGQQVAEGK